MNTSKGSNIDLNQIRIQLRSSIPSEIRKGVDQVRKALQEDPDDADLYTLLVEAGRENAALQDDVRNLLQGMNEKGSVLASTALSALNKPIEVPKKQDEPIVEKTAFEQQPVETDPMNLADEAYYAAEFDKAIHLYEQILANDPDNQRAHQQLNKAKLNRYSKEPSVEIPKEAVSLYRRARSYIAVQDFKAAIGLLNEAAGISHEQGVEFSEAKIELNMLQELLAVADYRKRGMEALQHGKWEDAQDFFHKAHQLDITDQIANKAEEVVQLLRKAETFFVSYVMRVGSVQDQMARLQPVADAIAAAENLNEIIGVKRFNILQAKYELYKACTELNNHRMIGFASQRPLVSVLRATNDILPPEDSTKKHAEDVLQKARKERFLLSIIAIFVLAFLSYFAFGLGIIAPPPPTPTTISVTITDTNMSPTPTATHSPIPTLTPSMTFTLSPVPSVTKTSTPQTDTAYVIIKFGHYWDKPNGSWIGEWTRNLFVTVLDKKLVFGSTWYLCKWDDHGELIQGWILGDYLSFVQLPTTTPTLSLTPQGSGYININTMHPQDQPNGKWVGELRRNQFVSIYNSLIINGDMWYFCTWDPDGEGWILSQYVVLGTPTPRP